MKTIGQILKQARENKKMSVSDIAHSTKAMVKHIEALEADDFSFFPAPIYAAGFIRLYAHCVGLNAEDLIQRYRNRTAPPPPTTKIPAAKLGPTKPSTSQTSAAGSQLAAKCAALRRNAWQKTSQLISRGQRLSLPTIRLSVKTWKTILATTGVFILALIAIAILWRAAPWKNTPTPANSSRWLQEPPEPYLNIE